MASATRGPFEDRVEGNSSSRPVLDYDTCPHGCVYCYAVVNRRLAQERFREHDPEGEFLFKHPTQAQTAPTLFEV